MVRWSTGLRIEYGGSVADNVDKSLRREIEEVKCAVVKAVTTDLPKEIARVIFHVGDATP